MGEISSGLLQLRPVTFRYRQPAEDGSKPLDYGLIAEEVANVYPDLVVRNRSGQIETLQYQKLTPMLINELQKQNARILAQNEQLKLQAKEIDTLREHLVLLEVALGRMSGPRPSLSAAKQSNGTQEEVTPGVAP